MAGARRGKVVPRIFRHQRPVFIVRAGNERGMALIIALVMLVLLTILGIWAIDTSSTDLKIAGNYRTIQYAFYAADSGVGYTTNPSTLRAVYNTGAGWSSGTSITVDSTTSSQFRAQVPSLTQGPLPQNGGASTIYDEDIGSSGWHGIYTAVTSTGNAMNNSQATVEAVVAQAVPN